MKNALKQISNSTMPNNLKKKDSVAKKLAKRLYTVKDEEKAKNFTFQLSLKGNALCILRENA
jgi:hypothetical protein